MQETAALLQGAGRKPISFEQWLRLHSYETKARGGLTENGFSCACDACSCVSAGAHHAAAHLLLLLLASVTVHAALNLSTLRRETAAAHLAVVHAPPQELKKPASPVLVAAAVAVTATVVGGALRWLSRK